MSKHRYLSFGTIVGLWPGSILLAFATLGIPAGSAEENSSPTAVLQSASSDPALVGEMAGFKSLVDQIKVTFDEGQSIASSTDRNLEPSHPPNCRTSREGTGS